MIHQLFVAMMTQMKTKARTFCERHLVAEDPWPFAEHETEDLLEIYGRTHSARALKELTYRWNAGRLNGTQIVDLLAAMERFNE